MKFKKGDVTIYFDPKYDGGKTIEELFNMYGKANLGTITGRTKIHDGALSYQCLYIHLADSRAPAGFRCYMSEHNLVLYQATTPDWEL